MIRLTLILCAGLFAAMMIGGRDHGQTRFGLMPQSAPETLVVASANALASQPQIDEAAQKTAAVSLAIAPASQDQMLINASFAPKEPVMVAPVAEAAAAPVANSVGRVLRVSAKTLNVRSGPGTDYSVMERLRRGDEVLVVEQGEGPDAWAMIRIEGDGVEGYVAARLLTE